MSRSLQEIITEVSGQVWSGIEPENLATPLPGQRWSPHGYLFLEALGEIQKDVPQERDWQCNTIEFCETFHRCGLTIVPCPEGVIYRVYTIQRFRDNSGWDWCRPAFYTQRSYSEVENWARKLRSRLPWPGMPEDDSSALPKLPLGFERADKATDSRHGRARSGTYAIHNHNLYLAPWIQSDEMVVIEWSGIKGTTMWRPEDLLSDEPALKRAIKLYVQHAHERDYGNPEQADVYWGEDKGTGYVEARSELMLLRREQTVVRHPEFVPDQRHHSHLDWRRLRNQPEPTVTDKHAYVFAHIGNNGTQNSNADAVASLALAWQPRLALSSGGNTSADASAVSVTSVANPSFDGTYTLQGDGLWHFNAYTISPPSNPPNTVPPGDYVICSGRNTGGQFVMASSPTLINPSWTNINGDAATVYASQSSYDVALGRNWHAMIEPYAGAFGDGAKYNQFLPAMDANDWPSGSDALFTQFFDGLPNNGRYYDVCKGHAHFFVLDAAASDPDGNSATSAQAEWLRMKLMLSPARWKIVVTSTAPYSSDGSNTTLQWPFEAWGADLVLSGGAQNYERFLVGNLPYIVNGLGGTGIDSPAPTQITGSQLLYAGNYGAGQLVISACTLMYNFVAIDGTVVDTLELTKCEQVVPVIPTTVSPITAVQPATSLQILTGPWPDPNGNITPINRGFPAEYAQDNATPVSVWFWSVSQQLFFPLIT